jgi:hypothetical protein
MVVESLRFSDLFQCRFRSGAAEIIDQFKSSTEKFSYAVEKLQRRNRVPGDLIGPSRSKLSTRSARALVPFNLPHRFSVVRLVVDTTGNRFSTHKNAKPFKNNDWSVSTTGIRFRLRIYCIFVALNSQAPSQALLKNSSRTPH